MLEIRFGWNTLRYLSQAFSPKYPLISFRMIIFAYNGATSSSFPF